MFGISSADSQAALLAEFLTTGGPSIPTSADVTIAELTAAVGTPAFDTDLTAIANADFASGMTDLQGYLADLVNGAGGGGLLSGLLGDLGLGSLGDGAGGLGGDLTTILGDLTGGLL